jgi:hypothetical protein
MPIDAVGSDGGEDGESGDATVADVTATNCFGARVTKAPGRLTNRCRHV